MAEPILFAIFATLALAAAVSVVVFKNPIHSALALVLTLFSLAGLFVVMGAYFVAAVQVIVYAGAIMVLFVFVIMLLNLGTIQASRPVTGAKVFAVILGIIFAVEAIYVGVKGPAVSQSRNRPAVATGASITPEQLDQIAAMESAVLDRAAINSDYVPKIAEQKTAVTALTAVEADELIRTLQGEIGKTERLGAVLFDKFLLPFEVTSFILLAALIGVIALVKPEGTAAIRVNSAEK